MKIEIPFENATKKGNYFGHKKCYHCGQVYDARFPICINCGSDVWGNLRSYRVTDDGMIIINEKDLCYKPKDFIKELKEKK